MEQNVAAHISAWFLQGLRAFLFLLGALGWSAAVLLITRLAPGESPSRSPAAAQEGSESPGPALAASGCRAGDVTGYGGSHRPWAPRCGRHPVASVPAFPKLGC